MIAALDTELLQRFAEQGGGSSLLLAAGHPLVHVNVALNAFATVLLLAGLWQIKRGRERVHGRTMLAALLVSSAFLTCYLIYHFGIQLTERFTHEGPVRSLYFFVLLTHIPLAVSVPFLAIPAAVFGAKSVGWGGAAALSSEQQARYRIKHLRLVRWAYPIWLYVSVTGVIVYLMLYHLWPSTPD